MIMRTGRPLSPLHLKLEERETLETLDQSS